MVYVGTSGWQYKDWRSAFYPPSLVQRLWLGHYAARFRTVELNSSFYRLPRLEDFQRWAAQTPDDFVMAVKMSRLVTHVRRLRDPEVAIELFLDRARGLGAKLGPVLVQLPPHFPAEPRRLAEALERFPAGVRVAVELRDDSWSSREVRHLLETHGAALCLADHPTRVTPTWRTAGWGFVRFHLGQGRPQPCYRESQLARWAERIARLWPAGEDVFVYFNNDGRGCAVRDAMRFADRADRLGLRPTRVPAPPEVRLSGGTV